MRTSTVPRPWRVDLSLFLLLSLLFALDPRAAASAVDDVRAPESTLKAAYLFQLANFVDWPENEGDEPLRLCILGDDPFGAAIDGIAGKKARGRQLALERFATSEGVEGCNVLYISASESAELDGIFDLLAGSHVLTVGDSKDFARCGGIVGFVVKSGKLRLEVNLGAAQEAGLKISAKLLELSRIVKNKNGMTPRLRYDGPRDDGPLGGRGGNIQS